MLSLPPAVPIIGQLEGNISLYCCYRAACTRQPYNLLCTVGGCYGLKLHYFAEDALDVIGISLPPEPNLYPFTNSVTGMVKLYYVE